MLRGAVAGSNLTKGWKPDLERHQSLSSHVGELGTWDHGFSPRTDAGTACGDVVCQDKISIFPQDLHQTLLSPVTNPAPLSLIRKMFQDLLLKPVHRNRRCVCQEGKLHQGDGRHFSQYSKQEEVRAIEYVEYKEHYR